MMQGQVVIFLVIRYVMQSSVFLCATLLSGGVNIVLHIPFVEKCGNLEGVLRVGYDYVRGWFKIVLI